MKIECTPEELALLILEMRKWINSTINPMDLSEIIAQGTPIACSDLKVEL